MTLLDETQAIEILRIFSQSKFQSEKESFSQDSLGNREEFKQKVEETIKSKEYQDNHKIEQLEALLKELTRKYHDLAETEVDGIILQNLRTRIHDCRRKIQMLK